MDEVDQMFGAALAAGGEPVSALVPEVAEGASAAKADVDPATGAPFSADQGTPMASLASYVMARFQENEKFRKTSGVSDKLDYRIRAQKCVFTDRQMDVLARKFGPDVADKVFVPITSTKIRAARAMLIDLANQSGEPLFRIEPTPVPEIPENAVRDSVKDVGAGVTKIFAGLASQGVQELPPEVMEKLQEVIATSASARFDEVANATENYARIRADRMQKKVWDLMLEGGWNEAFEEYIDYICTYGTGVIVGPVMRNVAKNTCKADKNGVVRYSRKVKCIPTFEAVNPCDCYPAPDAKDIEDGPLCIKVKYTADELARFAESVDGGKLGEGWIKDQVNVLLARHPRGGVRLDIATFSPDRRYCENNGFTDMDDCTFEGIRCFAMVRGSELLGMGIATTREKASEKRKIGPSAFYRVEVIVVDNRVLYCRLYNACEELPVSKGVFYTLPGSWWGEAVADKVANSQCVLNNCIASLMSNMPAASGAIFWVNDVQRLANKSPDALKLKAGMTVPFSASMMGSSGAPIGLLSVPSNAGELLNVFQRMQTQADLDSGLPAYTEGQSAGQSGALRTASGLAIFTEASTRGLKMVMTTTDKQVISRIARLTADWVLLNDDNMDLKGDVEIRPVGLIGKILKAQRDQQRLQLFQMTLNSQLLQQALGIKGVLELFRPSLRDIDVNPDDILPSKSKLAELELIQSIQQVFQATQAANGVQQNAAEAQGEMAGGTPGVSMPETPQQPGGVAERRGVA